MSYSQPPGWGPQGYAAPQERTLYQDSEGVMVTSARFVVGSTVYPIRGITAIQFVGLPRAKGAATAGILVGFAGFLSVLSQPTPSNGVSMFLCAGAPVILGLVFHFRRGAPQAIRVLTAGGQIDAVVTTDKVRASNIVGALNVAIGGM